MLYTIIATDVPESGSMRARTRTRHLEYLQPLVNQGRVLLAGPHPAIDCPEPTPAGMTGSLIVAEFESLEDAEAWAANDPYSLEGVFESVVVKPLIRVIP